ncbi:MAG: YncE family protein, partial [Deinococcus sp.]|nr:YncE family protein [Deinococcus sp.]
GVAVHPAGSLVYVTNWFSDTVSVMATATNTVVATVPVGDRPLGVAVSPDGARAYVVNFGSDSVSVLDTTTNSVIGAVRVGRGPTAVAFAQVIGAQP